MITVHQFATLFDKYWADRARRNSGKSFTPPMEIPAWHKVLKITTYRLNSIYTGYHSRQIIRDMMAGAALANEEPLMVPRFAVVPYTCDILGQQIYKLYMHTWTEYGINHHDDPLGKGLAFINWKDKNYASLKTYWEAFEEIAALFIRSDMLHQGLDSRKLLHDYSFINDDLGRAGIPTLM